MLERGRDAPYRGMRYFSADLHFGHTNIITYSNRPFANVAEMNENIIERWNAVVSPQDEVIVLGDLCLGKLEESLTYAKRLNGQITLLLGNHDRPFKSSAKVRDHWENIYAQANINQLVDGQMRITIAGRDILLCHFPYHVDTETFGRKDRYEDHRPHDKGHWLLHGHVHSLWRQKGRMINTGIDAWGGRPVSEEQIKAVIAGGVDNLAPLTWD